MIVVRSKNNVPVRLTRERWEHIIKGHPETADLKDKILETLINPDMVQEGDFGELIAIKNYENTPFGSKYIAVIYKETGNEDGFVITAYLTRMPSMSRRVLWKR